MVNLKGMEKIGKRISVDRVEGFQKMLVEQEEKTYRKNLRLVYNSVQRYCFKKGLQFLPDRVEDYYQSALMDYLQNKEYNDKYLQENNLPLKVILCKKARERIIMELRKGDKSLLDSYLQEDDDDLIELTEGGEANNNIEKEKTTIRIDYSVYEDNIFFHQDINSRCNKIQVKIVNYLLKGYTLKETAQKEKISYRKIKYQNKKLKEYLLNNSSYGKLIYKYYNVK